MTNGHGYVGSQPELGSIPPVNTDEEAAPAIRSVAAQGFSIRVRGHSLHAVGGQPWPLSRCRPGLRAIRAARTSLVGPSPSFSWDQVLMTPFSKGSYEPGKRPERNRFDELSRAR